MTGLQSSVTEQLRIHLFGQPRFSYGAPFRLSGPPRTLPLLAFLVLNRGAHLTRDSVAFALWPDDDEESARSKLRRHLFNLKSALPQSETPWFIVDGDTLMWNDSAGAWIDVEHFERCLKESTAMEEAVELYAGDLLPAIYDDWLIVIRDRLRSRYLAVLDALLLRERSRRSFSSALGYARRTLAEDPWREDTLRQLMSVRYESGDRTGALQEFGAFADRLKAELGVEPMPETLALRDAVLRGAALPDAGAPPEDAVPSGVSVFPFVGRGPELESLRTAWTRAARGRGSAILLAGEAGAGKSRLASEVALFAGAQGGRVLLGTTAAPERAPYQCIADALRSIAPEIAALDLRPIWLSALSVLAPEIGARRDDLPPLPALDEQRQQSRLFEAVVQCAHALAKRRPVIFLLEDLHWAGTSTLAALEFLVRRMPAESALLLGTYRSEEIATGHPFALLRRRLSQDNAVNQISIGRLNLADVCQLVAQLPALAAKVDAIGAQVHDASSGNALFVSELLRELLELKAVEPSRMTTLRATIEARRGRLSSAAASFADIASVAGAAFDIDILRDVSGASEDELYTGIAELVDRRFIKETGLGRFSFSFAHDRIRQTLYEGLPDAQRRRWHRRIAEVIERSHAGEQAPARSLLARHYDIGGDDRRAAELYFAAARDARALFANAEARAAAVRGLELTKSPGRLRFQLLLELEQLDSISGKRAAQQQIIDELRIVAKQLDDIESDYVVILRSVYLARGRSDWPAETALVDELQRLAEAGGDARLRALAVQERATHLRAHNRFGEALSEASAALAAFQTLGDADGEVGTLCLLAEIAYQQASSAQMQAFIERAHAVAQVHGKKGPLARVNLAAAGAAIMRREFAAAQPFARSALALYQAIGDREGEGESLERLSTALAMLGRFGEARDHRAQAAAIFADLGKRTSLAYLLFNASATELQLGQLSDAAQSLDSALEIFETLDDRRGRAVCAANLSMVRLLQGDANVAKESALRSLESARAIESSAIEAAALSNLGNAERELAEFGDALAHMQEAIALRERLGRPPTFEELADLALTLLEAGDTDAALATAQTMLAQAETSLENTVWPHYCFWIAARIFRSSGDEARAASFLFRAREELESLQNSIEDAAAHAAFANLPLNRTIRAAIERDEWPNTERRHSAGAQRCDNEKRTYRTAFPRP